jgi:membrane protease subunit (stomatin/prohibitin family)
MKRRNFLKGSITVALATAAVSLVGVASAGGMRSIGSQVRKGVHNELREEDQQEDVKQSTAGKEPAVEEEAGKEPETEDAGKEDR